MVLVVILRVKFILLFILFLIHNSKQKKINYLSLIIFSYFVNLIGSGKDVS